jgi:hypothetical protein
LARLSTGKKILILALGLVLMAAAAAAGGAWLGYKQIRQIEASGELNDILEEALSDADAGIVSFIESTSFDFEFSAIPLRIVATNIEVRASDTSLNLPRSEFGFSLLNLVTGTLIPSEARISGLEIEIFQDDEGWHAGPTVAFLAALTSQNVEGGPGEDGRGEVEGADLSALRHIEIVDAKVTVTRPDGAFPASAEQLVPEQLVPDQLVLEPIGIDMQRALGRVSGSVNVTNPSGGALVIDFDGRGGGGEMEFLTTITDVDLSMVYPYLGFNIPEIKDLGLIDGQLAVTVKEGGITSFSGDLATQDGNTVLPGFGELAFSDAAISFAYDLGQGMLSVEKFDIATVVTGDGGLQIPAGNMAFSGRVSRPLSRNPVVVAKLFATDIPFRQLYDIWPEDGNPDLRALITDTFSDGAVRSLGLDIAGTIHRDRNLFDIATVDLVMDLAAVDFEAGLSTIENIRGSLTSRIELSVREGARIEYAAANFLLLDASMRTTTSDRLVDLEGIEIRAALDGNVLKLTRIAVDAKTLGQMAMAADIHIGPDLVPRRLDMSIKAEQIDKDFLVSLWPEDIRPRTRRWIDGRLHGGQINGLSLNAGFEIGDGPPGVIYLNGEAQVEDAGMTYLRDAPVMTGIIAPLKFKETSLEADIVTGFTAGADVKGTRIIIRGDEAGPIVDVAVKAEGPFSSAVKILDSPRLALLTKSGLDVTEAEGVASAEVNLSLRIPKEGQTITEAGGVDLDVTGTATVASMNGFPQDMRLADADLEVTTKNARVLLSGRGAFEGAPGQINLEYGRAGDIDLEIRLEKSEEVTAVLNKISKLGLTGQADVVIAGQRAARGDDMALKAGIDLSDTALNLEQFDLVKAAGEAAELKGDVVIGEGRLKKISALRLDSEFLTLGGDVSFDKNGAFLRALIGEVDWPGHDITEVAIEPAEEGGFKVIAEAGEVDLRPLRDQESSGGGMALNFDLIADSIIVDDNVTLTGLVALKTREDGTGEAEFLGGLFLGGDPFMTEGTLRATFGGGYDVMEGRGLIGGAEATVSISPSDAGGHLLFLRSDNAGQVLKTLNILDAIRSGKLNMVAEFLPDEKGHALISFELEEFSVIEAPAAVQMLSVLSLAGLYSLVEGDGTKFSLGYARIETYEDRQIIHQARATGPALAVDLVGVLKPETRELEISGSLLPIYGFTKLLGRIPIVGELLTGVDNTGLLVTQFTLEGAYDEPVTSVNASSIVPGIFRDVFSPNWIKNERERLTGENGETGATGATGATGETGETEN